MPKLTDSQLMILSTAGQRDDGVVLPLPKSLKLQRGAVSHVLKNLLKKGLLDEQPTGDNAAAWREGKDGQRLTLVIADAGRQAIGVATDEQSLPTPENIAPRDSKRPAGGPRKARRSKGTAAPGSKKKTTSPAALRAGTKLALLVGLLQRKGGATIAEVMKATGWQAHSARGAISGALKKNSAWPSRPTRWKVAVGSIALLRSGDAGRANIRQVAMADEDGSASPYLLRPLRALEQVLGGRSGGVQPRPERAEGRRPFNSRDERAITTTHASHTRRSTVRS